jgi:integrase/recombinase XerC
VASRLARPQRRPPPEALRNEKSSNRLPNKNGARNRSKKNQAQSIGIGEAAARWAQIQPAPEQAAVIAREVQKATRGRTIEKLTAADVEKITASWKPHKPNTRRTKLNLLSRLLRHLERAGAPACAFAVPKQPPYQVRTVIATPEEIKKLLSLTPPWLRCFVLLCSQLGLRFMEAARACPAAWNPQLHTLSVVSKWNKNRIMPTTPELEELFAVAVRADEDPATPFIFILHGEKARTGPFTGTLLRKPKKFVQRKWAQWRKKLSINAQLTIHDLRRTRITEVYRDTKDIRLTQQFAGHSNIDTTALYIAPWDDAHILDAIRRTAPPGGWKKGKAEN